MSVAILAPGSLAGVGEDRLDGQTQEVAENSERAQTVARRKLQNFEKVCKVVYQWEGAHSGL